MPWATAWPACAPGPTVTWSSPSTCWSWLPTSMPPPAACSPAERPVQAPPRTWSLALKDWVLSSPEGRSLPLTTHEFLFVQHLVQAQGQPVSKRDLSDKLFGARAQNGSERLNLLVTRLRKKATEALGEALPIKTLYQIGYAFTVTVRVGELA